MKRISYILFLIAVGLSVAGCEKTEPAEQGSIVVGGISDRTLLIGGSEGSTATFSITAKYDWEILRTDGFVCTPSKGYAGTDIAITASATQANNTSEAVYLGELTFKLKSTKFSGISVYQQPQIIVEYGYDKVYAEANAGSEATIRFSSSTPDFKVEPSDGLRYEFTQRDTQKGKYRIAVSARSDNFTNEAVKVGEIGFSVNGIRQSGIVEVFQQPAIRIDKSRVMLSGYAGAQNTFQVITPFEFGVAASSQNFSMTSGDGNTVVVTANAANGSDDDIPLGKAEVYLAADRSCSASVDVFQRTGIAPQTVLFYFIGTSLQSHFNNNIGNAVKALDANIQGKSRVLVFIQSSTTSASLYELQYDPESGAGIREKIRDYAVPAKFTQQMLADNLADMIAFAPARSYGLIIGTHGKGWIPKSGAGSFSRNARRLAQERIWTTVDGAPQMRHMGDSATTQFNTDEFAAAVESTGVKMDYIIFDACFMSNIESLYDMRRTADRIVASPCEVMGTGFPYKAIMPLLLTNGGTGYDLDAVCRTFVDYYEANSTAIYRSACSALIDCSQIDALAQAMKRVNEAGTQEFDLNELQAYEGISSYYNPTHIFYDLEDYVRRSCADPDAVKAFSEQLDKTVSSRYHTERFYSAYNGLANAINYYSGITTSAPMELDPKSAYIEEWRQTAWYRATH